MAVEFRDEVGDRFASWQDLAQTAPMVVVDMSGLDGGKQKALLEEWKEASRSIDIKNDNERATLNDLQRDDQNLVLFAVRNLAHMGILQVATATLAETEAIDFIRSEIGGFAGLHKTLVSNKNRKRLWRAVEPAKIEDTDAEARERLNSNNYLGLNSLERSELFAQAGAVTGHQLSDLYTYQLEPPLSKLWHAVRILCALETVKSCSARGDLDGVLEYGIQVGESRKALSIKAYATTPRKQGGHRERVGHEARDKWLRGEFDKLSERLSRNQKCKILEAKLESHPACKLDAASKREWMPIKARQITDVVKRPS